jgi:hypothetical protein
MEHLMQNHSLFEYQQEEVNFGIGIGPSKLQPGDVVADLWEMGGSAWTEGEGVA